MHVTADRLKQITASTVGRVLIVDDDPHVADILTRLLAREGYECAIAGDGSAALDAVRHLPPDLILLDLSLPKLGGLEVCRRLKADPATRLIPVVVVSGVAESDQRIEALARGADDFLSKPVDVRELSARARSLVRMKRYTDDLDSAASIIMALAALIEARDGNTEGHCHRMANYATALGRELALGPDDLQALHRGGFLHDIGMLAIPDSVLTKSGPLEPEEYALVQSHTVIGESLCGNLRSLQSVRPIIRHHHERLDGSGYPDALKGDAIPLTAQIMSIVDLFDAVTTRRPYQGARPVSKALDLLHDQVHLGWRRHDLVDAFARMVERGDLDRVRI
jgi:putative two-component system response regulator